MLGALLALAALIGAARSAEAATLCVGPAAGRVPCYPTIQAAVNAARPLDRVVVQAGAYYENVSVPAGKDGIVITALNLATDPCPVGQVTIDAAPSRTASVQGTGVQINSPRVRLECLTIRHGNMAVSATGDGIQLVSVRALRQVNGNVTISGNSALISQSEIGGGGAGTGVVITGNTAKISNSTVRNQGQGCIRVTGNGAVIDYNTVRICEDGHGIEVNGANGMINNNTINNVITSCVTVNGNTNTIAVNTCAVSENVGFAASGTGNTVRNNSLWSAGRHGIEVTGDSVTVSVNSLAGVREIGIYQTTTIWSYNGVFLDNTVIDNGLNCYWLEGSNIRAERNKATGCGGGYEVRGSAMQLLNNRVERSGSGNDGFSVLCWWDCGRGLVQGNYASGANNDENGYSLYVDPGAGTGFRVLNNTAENNMQHGIYLSVFDAIISGNQAIGNGTEGANGFWVDGDRNRLENNIARNQENRGFFITGDDNILVSNQSLNNFGEGFVIGYNSAGSSSERTTLNLNTARGNLLDGIDNGGFNTVLTSNTAQGNRSDCVNSGSIRTNTGNSCADGSNFTRAGQLNY